MNRFLTSVVKYIYTKFEKVLHKVSLSCRVTTEIFMRQLRCSGNGHSDKYTESVIDKDLFAISCKALNIL